MQGESSQGFSLRERAQLGIVTGLLSSIMMALVIIAMQATWVMEVPWFLSLGTLMGGTGAPNEVGTYGLVCHLGLGVVAALLFTSIFRHYTVTRGLALGGLLLLLTGSAFTLISSPQLGGTILTIPLSNSVTMLVQLAIAYAAYGVTVGYVTKKHEMIRSAQNVGD
jgi:hypothetical protein